MGLKNFICVALAASAMTVGVQAYGQNTASWSLSYSDSEEVHKLIYGGRNSDGEIYMRCRTRDDFVFVIFGVKSREDYALLEAGNAEVLAPARTAVDEVGGGFYSEIAIPSEHDLFGEMAKGKALRLLGRSYPVLSATEQRSIANFARICGTD